MSSVQDFIQTLVTLKGLQNAQQALDLQASRDRVGAVTVLGNALQNITDPADRKRVTDSIATSMGLDPAKFQDFASSQQPSAAALSSQEFAAGMAGLPTDQRHQLDQLMVYRQLAGTTPTGAALEDKTNTALMGGIDQLSQPGPDGQPSNLGSLMAIHQLLGQTGTQHAVDQQGMNLSPTELAAGAGVGLGTRASAGEVLGASGQANATRASEYGAMLDFLNRGGVNGGVQHGSPSADAMNPQNMIESIQKYVTQLQAGKLTGGGEEFIQRNIAVNAANLLQSPLNPFPDLYPGNAKPGESQQQHLNRATQEAVERITGQKFTAHGMLDFFTGAGH